MLNHRTMEEIIMANDKKLHSVAALFNTPDEIIGAAKKTTAAGYKKFDVNTPYPVHGMDKAMGMGQSKVGFVTLFFGLTGATFIFLFMWWTFASSYNIVVGGKPFLAAPAFIPITFETTVLFAAISTVVGMIAVYFKLPANSHGKIILCRISGARFMEIFRWATRRSISRSSLTNNICASH